MESFGNTYSLDEQFDLLLEYCPNGDLEFFLKKFGILSMDVAKIYAAEIINILDYLHNNIHLSHRDLKPSNLMLDEDFHLKLVRNIFFFVIIQIDIHITNLSFPIHFQL